MVSIVFAATYTIKSLATSIVNVVVNPFVIFLAILATLLFLWGLFTFMRNAGSEEGREIGKKHMLNGLIGLFIMISVYGIMNVIVNSFGFKKPDFNSSNINTSGVDYKFKEPFNK
jgi:hypothetical protein